MSPGLESLFLAANLFVLPFWFLMIVAPGWRFTRRVMGSGAVVAILSALYVAMILPRLDSVGTFLVGLAGPDRAAVAARLLGSPEGAVIGWVHFLAFDLFVGRYIYLDSRERELSPWLMAPILILTLLLGPAGFLTYLLVRAALRTKRRRRLLARTSTTPAS
jgi:hypothetical protein